ncbi:hypothetical protein B0T17DRAFT_602232 [Bombardia bombarda]|uniref:Uncharacterized protein n=1 Tax=Bombardia bombarda TaxID=252184 RepID=A0AA40BVH6_9PEZI|nr:hypothetical protein B0T17DRAFT_602232 [Bombardia bombarda]
MFARREIAADQVAHHEQAKEAEHANTSTQPATCPLSPPLTGDQGHEATHHHHRNHHWESSLSGITSEEEVMSRVRESSGTAEKRLRKCLMSDEVSIALGQIAEAEAFVFVRLVSADSDLLSLGFKATNPEELMLNPTSKLNKLRDLCSALEFPTMEVVLKACRDMDYEENKSPTATGGDYEDGRLILWSAREGAC